jgi:hypothetical protein
MATENLRLARPSFAKKDAAIRAMSEVTGYSERSIRTALSQYKAELSERGESAQAYAHFDFALCAQLAVVLRPAGLQGIA